MISEVNFVMDIEHALKMTLPEEKKFRGKVIVMLNNLLVECRLNGECRGIKNKAIGILVTAESFMCFSNLESKRNNYTKSARELFRIDKSFSERIESAVSVLICTSNQ